MTFKPFGSRNFSTFRPPPNLTSLTLNTLDEDVETESTDFALQRSDIHADSSNIPMMTILEPLFFIPWNRSPTLTGCYFALKSGTTSKESKMR